LHQQARNHGNAAPEWRTPSANSAQELIGQYFV